MSEKTYFGRKCSLTYAAFAPSNDPSDFNNLERPFVLGRWTKSIWEGK